MPRKPWCNYSLHRTMSSRRAAGNRRNRPLHGSSKKRDNALADQWWAQATTD